MTAPAEVRVEHSEVSTTYSEEKTEPFSQSEIQARLRSFRAEPFDNAYDNDAHVSAGGQAEDLGVGALVSLDELVVPPDQDIRILVRPLSRSRSVSPSSTDNCQWLALRAQATAAAASSSGQPEHKVLAVTQTARDIKFIVNIVSEQRDESLLCELYYDPGSDNQILINRSDMPMVLTRLSQQFSPNPGRPVEHVFNPNDHKGLSPGTWRIRVDQTDVLDFRIMEKRPARRMLPFTASEEEPALSSLSPPSSTAMVRSHSDTVISARKRLFGSDEGEDVTSPEKRLKGGDSTAEDDDKGCIAFLKPPGDPLVLTLPSGGTRDQEVALVTGQPLLGLRKGDMIQLDDSYEIEKYDHIASSSLSSVYTAIVTSHPDVPPDRVVVVKVLKTGLPSPSGGSATPVQQQPAAAERNVIRQADIWLREYQAHNNLAHSSIVRLYGGDARYLSLYMEHTDARDLAARGAWRVPSTDYFAGDRSDALHILRDVAGGLAYVHAQGLAHNDVKPGNILYSRERGAVLCDFGLSARVGDGRTVTHAGTPYYIPPEFIGRGLRGTPGDVWALGVTMLYVLRRLVYPDSRHRPDRPKPLYWQIAEVNPSLRQPPRAPRGSGVPAAVQMQTWLSEVRDARGQLNMQNRLEWLVGRMVMPQPRERITMERVVREFKEANSGS